MNEQQLQQLAQMILQKDPKAMEAYKQLDPQTQKQVLAMVQQLEGGQGGQQITDQQLQQLAQGVMQNDPKAMEIAKQLPDEAKQRLVQMVQQLQGGQNTQGGAQGKAISPQVAQQSTEAPTQPQQSNMRSGGRVKLACGGKMKMKSGGKWIQKATASIKKRGTKGVCTGAKFGSKSCPAGSKRYNLAKTFKAMHK